MPARALVKGGNGVVALFTAGHFTHHLCTAIHVPLLPLIRNAFALDYFRSGLLVSSFGVAYGLAQLPMGWLADRVGRRWLLGVGLLGVAAAAFAIGWSRSYLHLALLLVLMGLLGGGYHPSAPPLISQAVSPGRLGRALGVHLTGGSASFFLAPILAGAIALSLGWRGPFWLLAIPTFLFGLLFLRLLPAEKRAEAAPATPGEKGEVGLGGVMRRLGILMGVGVLAQAVTTAVNSFIPMYLVDKHSLSPAYAGMFLSLLYGAGLVAAPLGGALSDRLGRKPVVLLSVLIAGPVIYLLTVAPFGPGLFALFLLLGGAMYMRMPVLESIVMEGVPSPRRSSFLGMYYFASIESSSIVAPAVGYLIDRIGLDGTFTLLGGVLLVAGGAATIVLRGNRRSPSPPFSPSP